MRPLLFLFLTLALCGACQQSNKQCVIQGTINPRFDGKRLFLVPLYGPQDAAHVDSVVVENGQFRFVKDTVELAVLRVDYHYRTGVQDLLVITEPGTIVATIDTISDATGTRQNDSLSKWKALSAEYNHERILRRRQMREAQQAGDSVVYQQMMAALDTLRAQHKRATRQLAENMGGEAVAGTPEGILRDFLEASYPRTYQRRLPDGTIVTISDD